MAAIARVFGSRPALFSRVQSSWRSLGVLQLSEPPVAESQVTCRRATHTRSAAARGASTSWLKAENKYWLHRQCAPNLVPARSYGSDGDESKITLEELHDRILNVLKLFDKVAPEKVTMEAHFMNDLGMDSLDAVEVVMAFEDEFAVEISDEEAEKIFTCKDAFELIKTKMDVAETH